MKLIETWPGIWPNLARAVEIAKVGNHSIELFYDEEEYPDGQRDCEALKKAIGPYSICFCQNGDISIEINRPNEYALANTIINQLKTDDFQKQIMKSYSTVPKDMFVNSAGITLMQTAIARLRLCLTKTETVLSIARTIAHMEKYNEVQAHHIAEAIQYNYTIDLASSQSRVCRVCVFGGLTIKHDREIDISYAEAGILYLQKLIKEQSLKELS